MIGEKTDVAKRSAAVSRRTAVGATLRHKMESWGFL
jgi:hypothetical protein